MFEKWLEKIYLKNKCIRFKLNVIVGLFFLLPVSGFIILLEIKHDILNDEYILLFFLGIISFAFLGLITLRLLFNHITRAFKNVLHEVDKEFPDEKLNTETDELSSLIQSFSAFEKKCNDTFRGYGHKPGQSNKSACYRNLVF